MRIIKFRYIYQCKRTGEFVKRELPLGHIESGHCDKPLWVKCSDNGFILPELIAKVQFIGRNDEKGNEIYEDDLVKNSTGRICRVVWFESPSFIGWDLKPVNAKGLPPKPDDMWDGWEIVGNIFENPELLKEAK